MKTQPVGPFRLILNIDEAALALGGISPRMVRKLIAEQQLPIVRLGRRVLVPHDALARWISSRTEAGSE